MSITDKRAINLTPIWKILNNSQTGLTKSMILQPQETQKQARTHPSIFHKPKIVSTVAASCNKFKDIINL